MKKIIVVLAIILAGCAKDTDILPLDPIPVDLRAKIPNDERIDRRIDKFWQWDVQGNDQGLKNLLKNTYGGNVKRGRLPGTSDVWYTKRGRMKYGLIISHIGLQQVFGPSGLQGQTVPSVHFQGVDYLYVKITTSDPVFNAGYEYFELSPGEFYVIK